MRNEADNEARNEGRLTSGGPGPGAGWQAVSELAAALGKPSALLRQYIHRAYRNEAGDVEDDVVRYVARPSGGRPEMWVAPQVVGLLQRHYGAATTKPIDAPNDASIEVTNEADIVASEDTSKDEALGDSARIPVARLVELERRAAVADVVEAELARVLAERAKVELERDEARQRGGEAERRADMAETLTRRARGEADRWRADAEAIRLAWHRWRRSLDACGRLALWRRRFPPEPPEFSAGPAIEMRNTPED